MNLSQVPELLFTKSQRKLSLGIGWGVVSLCIGGCVWWVISLGIVESLWFEEVGYGSMFWVQRGTQSILWIFGISLTLLIMGGNFKFAQHQIKYRPPDVPLPPDTSISPGYDELLKMLASIAGIFLSLGLIITHYLHEGWVLWSSQTHTQTHSLTQLSDSTLPEVLHLWHQTPILGLLIPLCCGLLLMAPITTLSVLTLILGLEFGFILAHQWAIILAAFKTTAFDQTDALFGLDIGFYVFHLPLWELIQFMFLGISLITFLGVTFLYLVSGKSIRKGRFPILSPAMLKHLYALAAILMLAIGVGWGLHCFTLLYSSVGALYGAGFTDRHVHLPVRIALGLGAIAIAMTCSYRAIHWNRMFRKVPLQNLLGSYVAIAIVLGSIVPALVQSLLVTPNELTREAPYIKASIEATRKAFRLDTIQTESFTPSGKLSPELLQKNDLTIRNIRLWNTSPLLKANRQLQRIRPYYEFADADIDRYEIQSESGSTEKRQVLISARELDFKDVPKAAKTWINRRLIYTHGYGFTVSPVNTKAASGLPEYFVQDIEADGDPSELSGLFQNIPTSNPRIYFGELTHHYIFTGTKAKELDYPRGNENALTTYTGSGGISIGNTWRRFVFGSALHDWQLILSPNLTPESKALIHRRIQDRVQRIAPFLQFDQDPYLVAASVPGSDESTRESVLYWIIDAYTQSDRYPYSDPGKLPFNYIRNSVKVVVDAYNGSVSFYSVEPDEPIVNTWQKLFPDLIQQVDAMPAALKEHLRYPIDLFQAQSEALLTYHMTDPQVFYNREDQWRFPTEIYGNEPSQVKPYYLIKKLPDAESEEFILLIPFTPAARNNLIAWMAARSDGENYGKQLLYQFPKRELVLGPEQVEALINQDPVISQQITLWDRQGSRVLQGNLLIIPIERSLLYVEPLYLEAEKTGVPTLARVVVLYQNKIAMASTLDKALGEMFKGTASGNDAIIRDIEG